MVNDGDISMLQLLDGALESSRDVPDRTIIINEPQRQSLKDPEDVIRPRQVREARGVGTFGAGGKLETKYLKQCSSCKRLVKTGKNYNNNLQGFASQEKWIYENVEDK